MTVLAGGGGMSREMKQDCSLTGPESQHAIGTGLAAAEWYHSEVPRGTMKRLTKRRGDPVAGDTAIWALLHVVLAAAGICFWGSWISLPFWLAYGVICGSACASLWHECGHGTAFRERWLNDVVYRVASFQLVRNPVNWRLSHARHHADTIIAGRDPEIAWMHPVKLGLMSLKHAGIVDVWDSLKAQVRNALRNVSTDERDRIPECGIAKAILWARVHMLPDSTAPYRVSPPSAIPDRVLA